MMIKHFVFFPFLLLSVCVTFSHVYVRVCKHCIVKPHTFTFCLYQHFLGSHPYYLGFPSFSFPNCKKALKIFCVFQMRKHQWNFLWSRPLKTIVFQHKIETKKKKKNIVQVSRKAMRRDKTAMRIKKLFPVVVVVLYELHRIFSIQKIQQKQNCPMCAFSTFDVRFEAQKHHFWCRMNEDKRFRVSKLFPILSYLNKQKILTLTDTNTSIN